VTLAVAGFVVVVFATVSVATMAFGRGSS